MGKILYVTNISRTVNTFFIPHMNMLVDQGNRVSCACKIKGEHDLRKDKLNDEIEFFDVPFSRNPLSINNFRALIKLYNIQKREKFDTIHVHTPVASFYTRLLKIPFKNIKMIYTAHGFHFYKGSSKLSWAVFYKLENLLSKYTDILITINEQDFNVAKSMNAKNVTKMNGVGVDFNEFSEVSLLNKINVREKIGFNEDDFILIMVGEHNKNKNQMQLIKAMEEIEKTNPKIKAVLIGDGIDLEKNKEYLKTKNINNVKILGFKKNSNEYINAADVLVSMSYREGLPKNIIEGLACKKIILATKIRGNEDLVKDGENGVLVKCNDIQSTIKKIKELYFLEKQKRVEMEQDSYKKVQKYKIENILNQLMKVYK